MISRFLRPSTPKKYHQHCCPLESAACAIELVALRCLVKTEAVALNRRPKMPVLKDLLLESSEARIPLETLGLRDDSPTSATPLNSFRPKAVAAFCWGRSTFCDPLELDGDGGSSGKGGKDPVLDGVIVDASRTAPKELLYVKA